MKAPEKIYILTLNIGDNHYSISKTANSANKKYEVEYTRTDAFIERACAFMRERLIFDDNAWYTNGELTIKDKVIEEFKNYMKGE